MVDLSHFIDSLKVTWFRNILKTDNKFTHLVYNICPAIKGMFTFGPDYLKSQIHKEKMYFGRKLLKSIKY